MAKCIFFLAAICLFATTGVESANANPRCSASNVGQSAVMANGLTCECKKGSFSYGWVGCHDANNADPVCTMNNQDEVAYVYSYQMICTCTSNEWLGAFWAYCKK